MSGFSRWGAGWRGVRTLRTWWCPGWDLVGEEVFALEVRRLRAAIVERNADPERNGVFVIPEEFVWPA